MDRRTFLKAVAQATVAAGATQICQQAQADLPARITVAGVGDCIPARRVSNSRDERLMGVVEMLRSTDCVWGNCETVFGDPGRLHPWPKGLDPHLLSESWCADELRWLGIDCVGTANNHSFDWGPEGMFSTLDHLVRVGLPQAGCGTDLATASRPAYFDSPAGRVAQVNCATTFSGYGAAGPAHPHVLGRPGLNPLHLETAVQIPTELVNQMAGLTWKLLELRGWASAFGDALKPLVEQLPAGAVLVDETVVLPGEDFDLLQKANPEDQQRILDAIGVARNNARLVMATIHAHESRLDLEQSPTFLEEFARATLDAGADVFFAAGPHVLRGIEMYKGKPIFYGLGNFVFHYETVPVTPAGSYTAFGLPADTLDRSLLAARIPYPASPRYWQAVVPILTYEGGHGLSSEGATGPRLLSIDLHPITLGYGDPLHYRGTPALAHGVAARQILDRLARLSEPYGTEIAIEDPIGRVVVG